MDLNEARKLKELERENSELKKDARRGPPQEPGAGSRRRKNGECGKVSMTCNGEVPSRPVRVGPSPPADGPRNQNSWLRRRW